MSFEPDAPNPYQPPTTSLDAPAPAAAGELLREDVMAFVGKKGSFYWRAWQKHGDSLYCGFNGPAFLLSFVWFAHRKMYKEAAGLLAIIVAWGAGSQFAFGDNPQASESMDRLVRLVVAVGTSLLANGLYRRRAKAAIARAWLAHPDAAEARLAMLAKEGGTSWLATLLALALMIGFVALALAAAT